jgi:SAM-dependent methyltransferase
MTSSSALHLPVRGHLQGTGPVDFVDRYYTGGAGWMLRQRLRWVRDALPKRCETVLEIGYGSGIFFYELSRHARTVVGIDVHERGAEIVTDCAEDGVKAVVARGSGMELPFASGSFDAVVIISALEFMSDPEECLHESVRVTRTNGRVIAVTPCIHPWTDAVWRVLSGVDPESDFQGGRQRVQHALTDPILWVTRSPRPRGLPLSVAPYELLVLRPDRRARGQPFDRARSHVYVDRRRLVYAQPAFGDRKREGAALT